MKKILITGISGFVGWFITRLDISPYQIIGTYGEHKVDFPEVEIVKMGLESKESIFKILNAYKPEIVIHLAAISDPNYCELHPEESNKINVEATINISDWCALHKSQLIFSSTDLVFDGSSAPYSEEDVCKPIMVYGMNKLMAEQYISATNSFACIVRLPLMYGLPENGKGYLNNWIVKLEKGEKLFAFIDEFRTQVWAEDALRGMFLLADKNAKGVYHLGSDERNSRFDFIKTVAESLGFDTGLIKPSYQSDVKMAARRPADVSLNSVKARRLGYKPKGLKQFLDFLK